MLTNKSYDFEKRKKMREARGTDDNVYIHWKRVRGQKCEYKKYIKNGTKERKKRAKNTAQNVINLNRLLFPHQCGRNRQFQNTNNK